MTPEIETSTPTPLSSTRPRVNHDPTPFLHPEVSFFRLLASLYLNLNPENPPERRR